MALDLTRIVLRFRTGLIYIKAHAENPHLHLQLRIRGIFLATLIGRGLYAH